MSRVIVHPKIKDEYMTKLVAKTQKLKKFSLFLSDFNKIDHLLDYFEEFNDKLSKKTLNSYLKSVINQ